MLTRQVQILKTLMEREILLVLETTITIMETMTTVAIQEMIIILIQEVLITMETILETITRITIAIHHEIPLATIRET